METITETQADAQTRAVFNDIRTTMGVAVVNLVWRRLAVVPSVLQWSWQTLKPHYQSGAIPAAAWVLREQLELPKVNQINANELGRLKHELKDAIVIDDVLRSYERGNAQNLIALHHLQMCLSSDSSSNKKSAWSVKQSSIGLLDSSQSVKQTADVQFGDIPGLPPSATLSDDLQLLVARSTKVWVPSRFNGVSPSVFRHLTPWPELLSLLVTRLEEIERVSVPTIDSLAAQGLKMADRHAAKLGEGSGGLKDLTNTDRRWLQEVLDVFINGVLARGVIIVPTLRQQIA